MCPDGSLAAVMALNRVFPEAFIKDANWLFVVVTRNREQQYIYRFGEYKMVNTKDVKSKTHIVADKRNPAWTFEWFTKIARETEQNVGLCKATGKLLHRIQQKRAGIISGEKLLRDYCSLIGVVCDDEDFNFSLVKKSVDVSAQPIEPVMKAVAVADSQTLDLCQKFRVWYQQNCDVGVFPNSEQCLSILNQFPEPARKVLVTEYLPEIAVVQYPEQPQPTAFNFQ